MKALVIDDARIVRKMLRQILTPLGFEVWEAEHGAEAMERLREMGKPDIILVDWNMPVMDGIEFVKTIRQNPEYNTLSLMMVTTQNEMEHLLTGLDAGVNEYVMKPFTAEVIQDKLNLLGILAGT
jgi:two-component system, chemotaxis family, chemotaxis protein CheY